MTTTQVQQTAATALAAPRGNIRTWMLAAGAVLTVWQLWAAFNQTPTTYMASYWLITWDHGFVRRGLAGEINQALFGSDLAGGASVLAASIGVAAGAAIAVVGWMLVARSGADRRLGWLGLLLVASPQTVRSITAFCRPDLLGFVLLLAVGLATLRTAGRTRTVLLVGISVGFAVLVLLHEGVVPMFGPWLLLLVVTAAGTVRQKATDAAALFSLPAMSSVVVLVLGMPSEAAVTALRADAEPLLQSTKVPSMLDFIGDGLAESATHVAARGTTNLVIMLLVGIIMFTIHLAAIRLIGFSPLWIFAGPAGRANLAVAVAGLVLVSTIGDDWLRWWATFTTMWLVVLGLILLRGTVPPAPAGHRLPGAAAIIIPAVALAGLALVPQSPAYQEGRCIYTYPAVDWSIPMHRVQDVVAGEQHTYKRMICDNPTRAARD